MLTILRVRGASCQGAIYSHREEIRYLIAGACMGPWLTSKTARDNERCNLEVTTRCFPALSASDCPFCCSAGSASCLPHAVREQRQRAVRRQVQLLRRRLITMVRRLSFRRLLPSALFHSCQAPVRYWGRCIYKIAWLEWTTIRAIHRRWRRCQRYQTRTENTISSRLSRSNPTWYSAMVERRKITIPSSRTPACTLSICRSPISLNRCNKSCLWAV